MKDAVYIFGHKNPDTDSICASIAYAEFKNKTGNQNAISVRLGDINRETQFVLDYFKAETPEYMETVKTQISDLDIDILAPISPEISLKTAWSIMKKSNARTIPVVDENSKLIGIVSLSNLTSTYMDIWDNNIVAKSHTSIENILDTLSGSYLYVPEFRAKFTGKIVTASMDPKSAEEIIDEGDIVICGNRDDTQKTIIKCKASLMIITGSHSVSEEVIESAKKEKCIIISTPYDTFTASRLILQSIPVEYVMTKNNIVFFKEDDYVEEIKDIMLKTRYRSYPVVDQDNKVLGSISRYHLISQNRKKIILVDHNEKPQSVLGIEDAEVLEIIDHHRVASIETGLPIFFRNEPVGSTSTIIANIFFENGIRPSKKTAGLLSAAIISDTLLFKSPTSTTIDKITLERLAEIADIDVQDFATNMFKAGTSLKGKTVDEIFHQDLKIYNVLGYKIGVSQVGTMDTEGFSPMKEEMLKLMDLESKHSSFNLLMLMLTDIINDGSEILTAGPDRDLIGKTFNVDINASSIYLPGILSRKKQVIPQITNTINNM
ncbi:MAG: putative manganese-dependent inorganic diphosphatase [Bacillota bacterium]|nr:putative manganese-dependent inorganic diphosphatase [Bacillota bacterium]